MLRGEGQGVRAGKHFPRPWRRHACRHRAPPRSWPDAFEAMMFAGGSSLNPYVPHQPCQRAVSTIESQAPVRCGGSSAAALIYSITAEGCRLGIVPPAICCRQRKSIRNYKKCAMITFIKHRRAALRHRRSVFDDRTPRILTLLRLYAGGRERLTPIYLSPNAGARFVGEPSAIIPSRPSSSIWSGTAAPVSASADRGRTESIDVDAIRWCAGNMIIGTEPGSPRRR